jgi:hypothetical protein
MKRFIQSVGAVVAFFLVIGGAEMIYFSHNELLGNPFGECLIGTALVAVGLGYFWGMHCHK